MQTSQFLSADEIRSEFSALMSDIYQVEVPAYGELLKLVSDVNYSTLDKNSKLKQKLIDSNELDRISAERHGAIRLGKAEELSLIRRFFAILGMEPVGYYDLGSAGIPVHSTAFRPVTGTALKRNPFRVFTSLLRLELIDDLELRAEAESILKARQIFTPEAIYLLKQAEADGGLNEKDATKFISQLVETFKWHQHASVDKILYEKFHNQHRLIADVVSFQGPHINHLTPRTLDIDKVQKLMPERGIEPKAVVEGPPRRECPILLRQTSFKALNEAILFKDGMAGKHTARFGEIEQRGIALTPKGRALYDKLLSQTKSEISPAADGSNADHYQKALESNFKNFPDDYETMRSDQLAYFYYYTQDGRQLQPSNSLSHEKLIQENAILYAPITYEDFLPVSAAGIFQSNLGDNATQSYNSVSNIERFEQDLETNVLNEFDHYQRLQDESLQKCLN